METTILEEVGRRIVMKCVGASPKYEVSWTKNSQLLLNRKLYSETKGRLRLLRNGMLQVRKLRATDEGIYSCW